MVTARFLGFSLKNAKTHLIYHSKIVLNEKKDFYYFFILF